jgi:hypothetical protein
LLRFVVLVILLRMNVLSANLTEQQRAFVRAMVLMGDSTLAAEKAGYSEPSMDGSRLKNLPHVQAAIAAEARRWLVTTAGPAALGFLYRIMTDERVPDLKLRAACAKDLASRSGFIAPKASNPDTIDGKSVSEMTREELVEASQRYAKELSDRAVVVIDNAPPVVRIDPEVIDILS